ncbi:MAG: transposase, partial [Betaproteobacteria bacterium]|nr:transposase [Betaproteobacteria bacterium]
VSLRGRDISSSGVMALNKPITFPSTLMRPALRRQPATLMPGRRQAISQRGLIAHVRSRKQEELQRNHGPQARPRCWVVERSHSWLNRFRKLMVRYEKSAASFEALLSLAAALICWRQETTIYG